MPRHTSSFRIGRGRGDRRGHVWYLSYFQTGRRHRPRVGTDTTAARQLAAQVNAQLESDQPTEFGFEPITIAELRRRWLAHHEQVLRSSVATIARYRSAIAHLLTFLGRRAESLKASQFDVRQAEAFVGYLRSVQVAPNGHPRARRRPLLDRGIVYILETCRSLFTFAAKRRHLSPYADNPFTVLQLDRIPIESARPIELLSPQDEVRFLEACDDWQFPLFLTLMLTGLRPGEATHLLLPEDLDLARQILRVRNKPQLGWQVKTRSERVIPLHPSHVKVLEIWLQGRQTGPVFRRRTVRSDREVMLPGLRERQLVQELQRRATSTASVDPETESRATWLGHARTVWRDAGGLKTDRIRNEFIRIARRIGRSDCTAPKVLRHGFATAMQDANVDPLIRNQLMGHSTRAEAGVSHGLGMTANYTHTRDETRRDQLMTALERRPLLQVVRHRLAQ